MINKIKINDKVWVKWHKQHELWIEGIVVGFTPKRIKVDLTWSLDADGKDIHIQSFIAHNVKPLNEWDYNHQTQKWETTEVK